MLTKNGDTLYVGGSGPGNYSKIQDAIDNASDGDTVFVYDDSSPYYENVDVEKSINLIGEDRDTTVIDGCMVGDGIIIRADNISISDFTIQNCSDGIVIHSDYSNIFNNNILNNRDGLEFQGDFYNNIHNSTIIGNNISSNNWHSINLWYYSENTIITGNTISNNGFGLEIRSSSNNTITGNNIISNTRFGVDLSYSNNNLLSNNTFFNNGLWVSYSYQNTVLNNTVNCKPLVYFENESDIVIDDAGQVILINCDNMTVQNLEISNSSVGIFLWDTHNSHILGNTISSNNYVGIFLDSSNNNTIAGNNISNNYVGIGLLSSNSSTLFENAFFNNGLWVYYSYQNTVLNNTVNGKPLVYLENESDIVIDDAGQVILINCDNMTVQNLEISNSTVGILLWNTHNSHILGNTISSNILYSIYLEKSCKNTITLNNLTSSSSDGISLSKSSNNTIRENNISYNEVGIRLFFNSNNNLISGNAVISNNGKGIRLWQSNSNNLIENTISNNSDGIEFSDSNNNIISDNTISNNGIGSYGYGIDLEDSSNNNFMENIVSTNRFGIHISDFSSNNIVYHNSFINNTQNAFDSGGNTWDNGYPSGGNYWDDYTGNDSNGDGIGDSPYKIYENNEDRYPFMNPKGWDDNYPPVLIELSGPEYGRPGIEYSFEVELIDPDEDSFYCMFDWGDGSYSAWLGPFNSYDLIKASHTWSKGVYNIRVLAKDVHGAQRNWSVLLCIEDLIPQVEITKPVKALYILNRKILPRFFRIPLIIGNIDITVNAIDSSSIEKVYFYIDEELESVDNSSPYIYPWTRDKITLLKHRHTLKVVAFDNAGNSASDEIKVRKFF